MKRTVLMRAGLMSVFWLFVLPTGAEAASTPLSVRDRAIIGEVNNLWASVADSIWPGAAAVNIPFLFVGDHYEYAIGFPTSLEGFNDSGDSLLRGRVQVRKRTLDRDLSASFPFQGFPAVVIGSPEGVSKSVSEWVITAGHEIVTGRENYRLHSQIVFPVSTYDRGEGHIAKMKKFERPSGGLRVYLPKASALKLHQ